MRILLLLAIFSVSFAEIEYESVFLPAYDPNINIVQKEIEEWIAKEKSNESKNKNSRSIFWEGSNSSHFNSSDEIILTENVQNNKRYRIAIAWLSLGEMY